MKTTKFATALLVVLLGFTHALQAQSSQPLEKKLREDLEKRKQRQEAVVLKANEQHKQFQNAGKILSSGNASTQGPNMNTSRQTATTTNTPAAPPKQNVIHSSVKKEENNQN